MWKAIFINDLHVAFSTISPGKKEEEGKSRRKFRAEAFARNYGSIFIFESKWLQKLPEQLLIAVGGSNSSGSSGGSCSQENSHSHIISFCMHVEPHNCFGCTVVWCVCWGNVTSLMLNDLHVLTCIMDKSRETRWRWPSGWAPPTITSVLHRFNLWRGFFSFLDFFFSFFAILASHARKRWRHEDELMSGWNNDTCTHNFGRCCRRCCCL